MIGLDSHGGLFERVGVWGGSRWLLCCFRLYLPLACYRSMVSALLPAPSPVGVLGMPVPFFVRGRLGGFGGFYIRPWAARLAFFCFCWVSVYCCWRRLRTAANAPTLWVLAKLLLCGGWVGGVKGSISVSSGPSGSFMGSSPLMVRAGYQRNRSFHRFARIELE